MHEPGGHRSRHPVDADLDSIYDVPFEAVSLGSLVSTA